MTRRHNSTRMEVYTANEARLQYDMHQDIGISEKICIDLALL